MVLLGVLAVAAMSAVLFTELKSELAPIEDRSIIIASVSAPEGATMAYTDRYARRIEDILSEIPEVKGYFMVVAPGLQRPNPVNSALAFINLKPWSERTLGQQEIAAALQPKLFSLPGVLAFPSNPPSLGQSFASRPVQFVVQANSYAELQTLVDALVNKAQQFPGLVNLDVDLKLNKPQLRIAVNRDKAADVGVEVAEIGRTLETLLGGRQVTRFKREGEQYDVIVKVADAERRTPDDLTSIYVRGGAGQLVQLDNVVAVTETVAPVALNHFNRLRAAIISAGIAPGYSLGDGLRFLEEAAKEVLPPAARTDLDGQSREFRESSTTLYTTFALALVFIYLVLAAQFESFIDPLIILLTVPLAVAGALLALKASGGTLNVYSQIGLVMLVGLITKNGILIVEFANQLQGRGHARLDAVIEAAGLRLTADPDDHLRDDPRRRTLGFGGRRRRREPPTHRLGYRRRFVARHAADLVRDPDGLYAARPPALHARRRNRVRRGGQGRTTSLGQNASAPQRSYHPPAPDARRCIARMRSGGVMSARLPRY